MMDCTPPPPLACSLTPIHAPTPHGTVEDGDREPAEFLDDAGKVKQPKGLRGQGGFPYLLYVTTQLCGMGVFRGLK